GALLALLSIGSACTGSGDAPVSPTDVQTRGPAHGLVSGLLQLPVLQRLLPLGQNQSASATIGTAGGSIRIPAAGVTVTFPSGAVAAPTAIRVTALAGSNVAYQFEPHGLVFKKPVVIAQDLGLTQLVQNLLLAPTLQGAYFADNAQLAPGAVVAQEEIPATVELLRLRMTFPIRHFSGYAVTSRRTGGYITSTGTRSPGERTIR
ncbi:MAG TPA: hypothetical protein VEX86_28435, partial [Longimicrobium sp.]|nr:hypothetical protein [Longimicrobium sp.]